MKKKWRICCKVENKQRVLIDHPTGNRNKHIQLEWSCGSVICLNDFKSFICPRESFPPDTQEEINEKTGQRQVHSTCSYKQATDAAQETLSNLLHSVRFAVIYFLVLVFLNAALASHIHQFHICYRISFAFSFFSPIPPIWCDKRKAPSTNNRCRFREFTKQTARSLELCLQLRQKDAVMITTHTVYSNKQEISENLDDAYTQDSLFNIVWKPIVTAHGTVFIQLSSK